MKYKIFKFFVGDFELTYDKKTVSLTDNKPLLIVTDDEYEIISEKYQSMILNGMLLIQRIEPDIEVKKKDK